MKEVSEMLSVSKSTVYCWISQGAIPSFKLNGIIRFDMDEIEEWVKSSKVMASKQVKLRLRHATKHLDIDAIVEDAIDSVKGKGRKPYKR